VVVNLQCNYRSLYVVCCCSCGQMSYQKLQVILPVLCMYKLLLYYIESIKVLSYTAMCTFLVMHKMQGAEEIGKSKVQAVLPI